jgi:hypothetical protein
MELSKELERINLLYVYHRDWNKNQVEKLLETPSSVATVVPLREAFSCCREHAIQYLRIQQLNIQGFKRLFQK